MDDSYDIVVVGGGPAGLSAAINGVARGCRVLVLDAGATKLARAERIDNYLGMPGLTGAAIMARFTEHALSLGVSIEKGRATNVLPMGERFMVSVGSRVVTTSAVVLAAGAAGDKAIPGEEALLGRGVSYCATCDGMLYRGKKAVVLGLAGDAPEEANFLAGIGVDVVYVCPGERPAALQADVAWMQGDLSAILGEEVVTAVAFRDTGIPPLQVQGVFLLREALAPRSMVSGLVMEGGFIAVDRAQKTNIPGIFACGDCTGPPLQIANAAGDGLIAGQEAAKYSKRTAQ